MDCSNYKELSGLRPDDLLDEERRQLDDHLAHCDPCRREREADEEILSLVDSWSTLESEITAADIRARDGLGMDEVAPVAEVAPTPPRRGLRLVPVALALAAAIALAVTLVPRMIGEQAAEEADPTFRLKGATPADEEPVSLDLQLSVETSLGGTPVLSPGQESATYGPGEGLLFGVRTDGDGSLVLAEQTPSGAFSLLGPDTAGSWTRSHDGNLALVDGDGRRLAYQPDAGPGTYHFTALLIETGSIDADTAQSLIRGDEVSGVSLLAMDSFAIQWAAGDDGDLAH